MKVEALHELIEYKFAPEPLIAVQGLVNTYSFEDEEELLPDPDGARRWLVESGLIDPDTKVSAEEYGQLLEVRAAVRSMIESNLTGEIDPGELRTLRRLVGSHPAAFKVTDEGEVRIDLDPASSVGGLIAQMLAIIARSIDLNEWQRLKICLSDDCRWAFYDTSKNRGGTWCRMEVCGNRNKNRRYRSKTASDHRH